MKIYRVFQITFTSERMYDTTICYCSSREIAVEEKYAYQQDYGGEIKNLFIGVHDVITEETKGSRYLRDLLGTKAAE